MSNKLNHKVRLVYILTDDNGNETEVLVRDEQPLAFEDLPAWPSGTFTAQQQHDRHVASMSRRLKEHLDYEDYKNQDGMSPW